MILRLQEFIYKQLNTKEITDKENGIYYQVPANNNFPYLYIGDFHQRDSSTKTQERVEASFKLYLYLREKSLKNMLELAEVIKRKLTVNETIMIKCYEEKIVMQNDGTTQQIIIFCKARLEQENV